MTRRLHLLIALAALCAAAEPATAQSYPTRPVSMIVPYPAGGVTDGLARLLADHMKGTLGQTIVVENVGGAGGSIGAGRVARASPDGYTFLLGNAETHVFNAAAQTLPYDVVNDFEPVALLPRYPFILVTSNAVPATNLKRVETLDRTIASDQKVQLQALQSLPGAGVGLTRKVSLVRLGAE